MTSQRKVVKAGKHERIRALLLNITKPQRQWLESNQEPGEAPDGTDLDNSHSGKKTAFPGHPQPS